MLRVHSITALAVLAAAACSATVDPIGSGPATTGVSSSTADAVGGSSQGGNGQGGSGDGGVSTGGGNPTAAGGAAPTSIALFRDELPDGDGGSGSTVAATGTSGAGGAETSGGTSGVGGASPAGEDLILVISNSIVSCGDPYGHPCPSVGEAIYITLRPDQQVPSTYSFSDLAVSFGEWSAEGEECQSTDAVSTATGGPSGPGSLTILSSDSTSVHVELAGTQFPELDGPHEVSRCTQVLEPGFIAYFPSELPDPSGAGGASSVTVSTGGGDQLFSIKFGDHPLTCGDPFPLPGSGQTFEDFTISLPFEMVVADTSYPLSNDRIECNFSMKSGGTGTTSGGSDEPGTISFEEVTNGYVDVTIDGSPYDFANGRGQVPRCNP